MHWKRAPYVPRGEMLHQRKEIGQVLWRDPLLVKRENEPTGFGLYQIVGVLDPFGDAFAGGQRADVVAGDEGFELLVGNLGIDCHARATVRREAVAAA